VGKEGFCFYYLFNTNFSGTTKFGEYKNFERHCPRMSPGGYGPGNDGRFSLNYNTDHGCNQLFIPGGQFS